MIYNKLIVPVTRILSSREACTWILLKRIDILSQKHLCCKKGTATPGPTAHVLQCCGVAVLQCFCYTSTIVPILLTTTVYLGERFPHPLNGPSFYGLSTWNSAERKYFPTSNSIIPKYLLSLPKEPIRVQPQKNRVVHLFYKGS